MALQPPKNSEPYGFTPSASPTHLVGLTGKTTFGK